MGADSHICTHCYYEGKPVKPPSDKTPEPDDTGKAIARVANLIFPGLGLIIKPLALFLCLPIYLLMWIFKPLYDPKKHCQHCGLPLMVRKNSDAGEVAMRKLAVKMGQRFDAPQTASLAFGREVKLPGDEQKKEVVQAPRPEKLPSLEAMLQEAPTTPTPAPEQAPVAAEIHKPKKPVDPDQF